MENQLKQILQKLGIRYLVFIILVTLYFLYTNHKYDQFDEMFAAIGATLPNSFALFPWSQNLLGNQFILISILFSLIIILDIIYYKTRQHTKTRLKYYFSISYFLFAIYIAVEFRKFQVETEQLLKYLKSILP